MTLPRNPWLHWLLALAAALALTLAVGCASDPAADAAKENTALHTQLEKANLSAANAAEANNALRTGEDALFRLMFPVYDAAIRGELIKVSLDDLKRATELHDQNQKMGADAAKAIAAIPVANEAAGKAGDALEKAARKAIAEKNSSLRDAVWWFFVSGGLCVAAGIALTIYWTEKPGMGLAIGLFGGCLIIVSFAMGWALDHEGLILGLFVAGVAAAFGIDLWLYPKDGWGHWLWSTLGRKSPEPGKAV